MSNQNWNEIGKNISDMVEEAIDSEDFSKLSQMIQTTVGTAVNNAMNGGMNGTVKAVTDSMNAVGNGINKTAEYLRKKAPAAAAQNPWKGNGKFEKKTADYMTVKDIPKTELYSPGSSTRAGGYLLTTFGGIGCVSFGIAAISLTAVMGTLHIPMQLPLAIVIPFFLASAYVTSKGTGVLARFRRFKNYINVLGTRTCITVQELADSVGKSEKAVVKDLRLMIEKEMFRQGHLDAEGGNFFVTHEGYEAYRASQQQIEERKIQLLQEKKAAAQRNAAEKSSGIELSEEVKKLIADGNDYIQKIHQSNDAIPDEAVSAKLDDLEVIVRKIFEYVEQHPESAPETKKLMRYYLPTTIKLLDSYQKLDDHPMSGSNIEKSKKEIETTLDTLNQAFARLFDNLYQDTSMDITSDISVLNTMLAQEGLTGDAMK